MPVSLSFVRMLLTDIKPRLDPVDYSMKKKVCSYKDMKKT